MKRKIKEREEKNMVLKRNKGITLVALVVTIIILIILATISMIAIFGEHGLITKLQQGKDIHEQGKVEEQNYLDMYAEYSGNYLNGIGIANSAEPDKRPLVNKDTVKTTNHEKIIGEDELGNGVVVPKGFKIAEESGTSVKEGIIIEDDIGNQFVWIPVSNIDGSGSNKIKVDSEDEEGVEITLGRYTFATLSPGTPTIVQKGSEYDKTVNESNKDEKYKIKHSTNDSSYMYELSQGRLTNYRTDKDGDNKGINTTALNLKAFIESVRDNHGYYIARYEASFGSGETNPTAGNINTANYITNQKPLSKKSTKYTRASSTEKLEEGMLWTYINQGDAAKISRNMYTEEKYGVTSDLINGYMWDTAIVYIQAMGNSNYANERSRNSLKNTGETGDEKCHIYDMAGNTFEWTTENSTGTYSSSAYPCTLRGGYYDYSGSCVASRIHDSATTSDYGISFRPGLYIK